MVITEIPDNEKKILTLFTRHETLNKQQILELGVMSWATITKIVNSLVQQGVLEVAGTSDRKIHKGKNSYIYRLSDKAHTAIGIDIEYLETRIILLSIKGEILFKKRYATPQKPDLLELQQFLADSIQDFLEASGCEKDSLKGIGIGIPGISIPVWLTTTKSDNIDDISKHNDLKDFLQKHFKLPVRIENNVRAYAMFERWHKSTFNMNDFIFISVRTGVGSGIVINDNLYSGQQALAGEIGHFTIEKDGELCRCGKHGCLETRVNQLKLFNMYREKVLGSLNKEYSIEEMKVGLADLFSKARKGDATALAIIHEEFSIFAGPLANLIMILNIRDVIISGYFGDDGDIIVPILTREIQKLILPKISFSISYYPFEPEGFIRGAALLVLKDFLSAI